MVLYMQSNIHFNWVKLEKAEKRRIYAPPKLIFHFYDAFLNQFKM